MDNGLVIDGIHENNYFQTSATITELLTAMLSMDIPAFCKDTSGYGYKYQSYDGILEVIKPILKSARIILIQAPVGQHDKKAGILTRLQHVSGEYIQSIYYMDLPEIKGTTSAQKIGGAITYGCRYASVALLSLIIHGEDFDAGKIPAETVKSKPGVRARKALYDQIQVNYIFGQKNGNYYFEEGKRAEYKSKLATLKESLKDMEKFRDELKDKIPVDVVF